MSAAVVRLASAAAGAASGYVAEDKVATCISRAVALNTLVCQISITNKLLNDFSHFDFRSKYKLQLII